jgi:acyl-CoA reductase-like NAD-dependent aldehyde dehydrogenase
MNKEGPASRQTAKFLDSEHRLLIGGEWVRSKSGASITEQAIASVSAAGPEDIDAAVEAARHAFVTGPWPAMSPAARSRLIWALAEQIEANKQILTELEILDNGMPLNPVGRFAVPGAVKTLQYYAGWPSKIRGHTLPADTRPDASGPSATYTRREPVGVVGQITPWNYPLGMAVIKLGPALATGCTVVLKPDEHTPLSALFLGELIRQVGIPPGVVNIVPGYGEQAGAALTAHADVDKVAFTGSSAVGKIILKAAAGNLKRVSLELGGKSPFIVFPDADIDRVINEAARLAFFLQGQNCQCPSRIFIHEAVFDRVVNGVAEIAIGPLISGEQLARVQAYVASGKEQGAELVTGGLRPQRPGYFMQPTVFARTNRDMRIVREEIFGPVTCMQSFADADLDDVARQANDTIYGLIASVWTKDLHTAHKLAETIKAGVVGINHHGGGDIYAPFGGYKQSGWGREFGAESLDMYLETKTVVIRHE